MTDQEIASKIIQALAHYLKRDPASITEAHHLRDDLGLDSVAVIELLFEIEERFKIQIPDQDLPGLSTVGSVAAYVQQRLTSGTSAPALAKPARTSAKPARVTAKPSRTSAKPAPARNPKKSAPTSKKKKKVTTQ
ncbi:MAG: acyl carrier protein [Nitrospirae bacterium]|nr:acyl carrier protein [Nitrospirota bacterium]